MDIQALIMAGGIGTRFWPLSRKKKPKQFLPIISQKTMIEETVSRLLPRIPLENIHTIANTEQTQTIRSLFPHIPSKNLMVEPRGKNTAPSLLLATASIYLRNPESVVIVLPADHLIQDAELFINKLFSGAKAAGTGDYLITFGIPPTFPSTGYGYIQFSKENSLPAGNEPFYPVQEFKEKPDSDTAKIFCEAGNYFWNSGMFIWQAGVFGKKLKEHAPDMFLFWERMLEALKKENQSQIASIFADIPSISIDYALMEKAKGVLMAEGNFGWSDVGTWSSLLELWPKDQNRNTLRGDSILLDSSGCLVYNPDKLTAIVGLKDIIVVDTEDALLICRMDKDQKVKDVVDAIKKSGKDEYL